MRQAQARPFSAPLSLLLRPEVLPGGASVQGWTDKADAAREGQEAWDMPKEMARQGEEGPILHSLWMLPSLGSEVSLAGPQPAPAWHPRPHAHLVPSFPSLQDTEREAGQAASGGLQP
jgi:hypothetical protein